MKLRSAIPVALLALTFLTGCGAGAEDNQSASEPEPVVAAVENQSVGSPVAQVDAVLRLFDGSYFCLLRRSDDLAGLRAQVTGRPAPEEPSAEGETVAPVSEPIAEFVRGDDGTYIDVLVQTDILANLRNR